MASVPMGPLGPGVHSAPSTTSGIVVTRDSSLGGSFMGTYGLGLGQGLGGLGLALQASGPASSALSVLSDDMPPSLFALQPPYVAALKVCIDGSKTGIV